MRGWLADDVCVPGGGSELSQPPLISGLKIEGFDSESIGRKIRLRETEPSTIDSDASSRHRRHSHRVHKT